jgi:hypothetical protein
VMIPGFEGMSVRNRRLLWLIFALAMVLGAFEDVFGRQGYAADAISYLNIVRAIHAGDWRIAFTSYWGLGYPLLASVVTKLAPATEAGEWVAVHVLNLLIFAIAFFSFYWLVGIAGRSLLGERFDEEKTRRFVTIGAAAIFLSIELSLDNVSRVGPDLLVSCLVFKAMGMVLRLREDGKAWRAVALGTLCGFGYVVKSIFLPLTILFLLAALIAMWKKRGAWLNVMLATVCAAVFAVPYVAGMSWAQGHMTLGDSGALNYIWNVDKLEPGGLWQGQPPQFGRPLHPAKMVLDMPHIYLFDGPFAVTFAPFFDPPYYYAGAKRFFSVKAQVHAIGGNVLRLGRMLRLQIVLFALAICWVLGRPSTREPGRWREVWTTLWPMVGISTCGIGAYLLVVLEYRYISSFVAMLLLVLLLVIANGPERVEGMRRRATLGWILLAGCALNLLANEKDQVRDVVGNTLHHRLFYTQDQWIAGEYLAQTGLRAGDKVAIVSGLVDATMSTWAYMDRLQIVGILGGSLLETQHVDFDLFWSANPEKQREYLEYFHAAGARAVVAVAKPDGVNAPGWEMVPGTGFWVYRF